MSGDAADGRPAAEETGSGHLGVLATWRVTPTSAKAILAGVFISRLAGFLQLFLVLFLTHRGFTTGQAGLALGLYGFGSVLGAFTGGWLSDRLSARAATLISMAGSALLLVAILYLKNYPLILVAVILLSTIGVLYRPAAQTLLTEVVPAKQLVMVTAMYRLCLNLGTTAAPLIGVALVAVSYDLLFWAEALAALAYGLIALRALPKRERSRGDAAAVDPGSYWDILRDWRYMFYLAAVFFIMVVYTQYVSSLPLAIQHAKLSLWWYGLVVTLNAVLVVVAEVPATKYVQTWPLRATALAGFGLIAFGYGVYAIAIVPALLIVGTIIWTASEIIGGPTTFAYPGIAAPAHLRGRYFGAMQSMVGLGSAVGPIVGVTLWNHVGQGVFYWAVVGGVICAVCAGIGIHGPASSGSGSAPLDPTDPAERAELFEAAAVPESETVATPRTSGTPATEASS